jgi:hypothetical protein
VPDLTRRPHDDPQRKGWHVYFGDVRIGHIAERAGVPKAADQWGWNLGFYPGTDVGIQWSGTGRTFEEVRKAFERAWYMIEPTLTEADYERWREQRDFAAWKHRMWAEKLQLPTQTPEDRSRCFCGAEITNAGIAGHVRAAHRGIGA